MAFLKLQMFRSNDSTVAAGAINAMDNGLPKVLLKSCHMFIWWATPKQPYGLFQGLDGCRVSSLWPAFTPLDTPRSMPMKLTERTFAKRKDGLCHWDI
jgi:hypothetical protein